MLFLRMGRSARSGCSIIGNCGNIDEWFRNGGGTGDGRGRFCSNATEWYSHNQKTRIVYGT